jgi:hypothetical protein
VASLIAASADPASNVLGAAQSNGASGGTSGGPLARTGRSPLPLIAFAAALMYIGYVAILLARRRRVATLFELLNPPAARH